MADKDGKRDNLVDLVRRLADAGKTFSITIEDASDPIVGKVHRQAGGAHLMDMDDPNCTKWVYVPGKGLVCVEHG